MREDQNDTKRAVKSAIRTPTATKFVSLSASARYQVTSVPIFSP